MIAVFRHRFTICLLSLLLCYGIMPKANYLFGCKCANVFCKSEANQNVEDDQTANDDKPIRATKRSFEGNWLGFLSLKTFEAEPSAAHNRIYLLGLGMPPLIAIISEPPEFA